MATNVIYDYGNLAGPGPSYFRSFVGLRIAEQTSTAYRLEWNHAIWVEGASADFYGTVCNYSYWVNSTEVNSGQVNLYRQGWYADDGWHNAGWFSSGQSISLGAWSGYGGHNSNVDRTYTVPQLMQAPDTPTECTLIRTNDTLLTMNWNFATSASKPVTAQERALSINDGSWNYTAIANGTTKSATITAAPNNKYYAAIRTKNSVGNSPWKYSNYVYTAPPAPMGYGFQYGNMVSCSADATATRYLAGYEWQYSANDGSTWAAITGNTNAITHTATVANPKYRVRVKNQGNVYSTWTVIAPTANQQVFINVPDGSSIKEIYIWK